MAYGRTAAVVRMDVLNIPHKSNKSLIELVELYSPGDVFSLYDSCASMNDIVCSKVDAFDLLYLEILAVSSEG